MNWLKRKAEEQPNNSIEALSKMFDFIGYEPIMYRVNNSTHVVLKIAMSRAERATDAAFERLTWAR